MGSGCSRSSYVRQKIRKSIIFTENSKSVENGKKSSQDSKQGKDGDCHREEEDELSALSPNNKLSASQTRGVSAASTVLPGTSISLSPVTEELSDLETYKPLPDMDMYPDKIQNLLLGRCSSHKTYDAKDLREIDLLVLVNGSVGFQFFDDVVSKLFISLSEMCHKNGGTLNYFIFGHPPVPCGRGYRILIPNFVKKLIKSKRSIVLVIFGHEVTPVQPPEVINQTDFDEAVRHMPSVDSRELVHCLYQADVNDAAPCYRLQSPDSAQEMITSEDIIATLESALSGKQIDNYITSVFEDIIRILKDTKDDVLMERSILIHLETPSEGDESSSKAYQRLQRLLIEWEARIPDTNKLHFLKASEWEEISSDNSLKKKSGNSSFLNLLSKLEEIMLTMNEDLDQEVKYFTKLAGKGIEKQLRDELLQQEDEVRSHLKTFQDRPELISSVMNYVAGSQTHPLIVQGRQGRGKSALLAVVSVLSGAVFPSMAIILRSVGVSTESFTQERVLRSVCEQIASLYGKHPSLASRSIAEHNSFFSNLLKRACAERPLLIILDGLDQVEEYSGRSLKWFPATLPPHVKLILSLRDDSTELQELQEMLQGEDSIFLNVPDLDVDDTLSIIEHLMVNKGRRLTDAQINFSRICVTDNSYPRYAHIFAHVACSWQTLSIPEHFWSRHSLYDIVVDYLHHIVKSTQPAPAEKLISSLSTLKHGVLKSEIMHTLKTESRTLADCCLLYIHLKFHLSPLIRSFIRKGHIFFHFKCQLYRKLFKTYLGKEHLTQYLQMCLEYMQNDKEKVIEEDSSPTTEFKTNHKHHRWREVEETTHLKIKLNQSVRMHFFDLKWLYERVTFGDPYLLLEEIKLYKRKNPDDREIDILRKFLQLSAYSLRRDGRQLYSHVKGRSQGYFLDKESSIKYPTMKFLVKTTNISPPVPYFNVRGPCLRTLADSQKVFPPSSKDTDCMDIVVWLNNDGVYFVTYSTSKGEVEAWNATMVKKMTSVKDVECLDDIVPLGRNAEVLVLRHNKIEVLDLARGTITAEMTELIDVSYGIKVVDDGKSILAMSETHDEILRFDTHSGHVGNRIFSGEHRQLHCLLVSENGEVCVCGDAVQKPYPLLIWNVQTGVLLRQISIAHHEFLARLSRINYDGRLLFATAKDLLDSGPTFLLVYDTNTGTVMWEAKPDSNITALGLCQETERIVMATEKGDIHGWDMFTGDEGFAIFDPSCCVNRIETAVNRTFLTWDPLSQDRCLKLWSTTTGESVATFTADFNIYDFAFSHDGQSIALIMCNKSTPAVLSTKD